ITIYKLKFQLISQNFPIFLSQLKNKITYSKHSYYTPIKAKKHWVWRFDALQVVHHLTIHPNGSLHLPLFKKSNQM
ncbi:hypothetical protein LGW44_08945, partial [Streptococcus mutans]|nr:hypothetical protein [Streptococcus mutans]